jgi:surfeit locus 1 family protein
VNRSRLALAGAATLVGVALLTALGVWQLKRLAWKEALIAAAESRAHAAPAPLPPPSQWPALNPAAYEYRRVEAQGMFDYAHQERVFGALEEPRGRYSGIGFYVMTPLRLASGEAVIVNRGFVPEAMKGEADKGPRGEVAIVGLMRASEPRNLFTPADDPAQGVFYARDVEALAKAMQLGPHAPFSLDAEAGADPLPQGGETRLSFVNNHLSYAFTWFGLAAALIGVFTAYAWGQRRG